MYQVTAIYYGSEIGYGEGEGFDYALEECIESMDAIYNDFSECEEIIINKQRPALISRQIWH